MLTRPSTPHPPTPSCPGFNPSILLAARAMSGCRLKRTQAQLCQRPQGEKKRKAGLPVSMPSSSCMSLSETAYMHAFNPPSLPPPTPPPPPSNPSPSSADPFPSVLLRSPSAMASLTLGCSEQMGPPPRVRSMQPGRATLLRTLFRPLAFVDRYPQEVCHPVRLHPPQIDNPDFKKAAQDTTPSCLNPWLD